MLIGNSVASSIDVSKTYASLNKIQVCKYFRCHVEYEAWRVIRTKLDTLFITILTHIRCLSAISMGYVDVK
jgi:hypothetical protein